MCNMAPQEPDFFLKKSSPGVLAMNSSARNLARIACSINAVSACADQRHTLTTPTRDAVVRRGNWTLWLDSLPTCGGTGQPLSVDLWGSGGRACSLFNSCTLSARHSTPAGPLWAGCSTGRVQHSRCGQEHPHPVQEPLLQTAQGEPQARMGGRHVPRGVREDCVTFVLAYTRTHTVCRQDV